MRFRSLTTILVIVILSGCAAFRDGTNPVITKWPPAISSTKNKSIALQVSINVIQNGEQLSMDAGFLESWHPEVKRAYESSDLFSAVKSGSDQSDIYADVKITNKRELSAGLGILSSATFFLVPNNTRGSFIVKTTFKDHKGTSLASVEKTEGIDFWEQLFLLPLVFSNFPLTIEKEVVFDLNRNTIIEANNKGVFNKKDN